VYNAAKALFAQGQARAEQLGVGKRFLYLNYAAQFQDPLAGYGPASVERLQAASAKYDPSGVFKKLVPGGFKIPETY
jgi:hypothetical protein